MTPYVATGHVDGIDGDEEMPSRPGAPEPFQDTVESKTSQKAEMSEHMIPSELEQQAIAACLVAVQRALLQAAEIVCPLHLNIWALPKEKAKQTARAQSGPDLMCHAPSTVWRRVQAEARRKQDDDRSSLGEPTPMRVTSTSDYGIHREAVYHSAKELAQALLAALPESAWGPTGVVHTCARDDGCLLLTTQLHMRKQRVAGRLQCSLCGDFLSGSRGLRDHYQIKHGQKYEDAKAAHTAAHTAIMPYAPPQTVIAVLARMWTERAAEEELARRTLPPALAAARDGDVVGVRTHLAGCADANAVCALTDRHGSNCLHWAAGGGHVSVCSYLVESLGVPVNDAGKQKDRRTALHWAARNGHVDTCRWLVSRGASVDSVTVDGTSPLHWAVWRGELGVCDYLVDEAGADVHATNSYGCNAIQWAAQSDCTDGLNVCSWLRSRNLDMKLLNFNGHSALHKAAVKGNARVCGWLLAVDGAALGREHLQPDADGNTPSIMAACEGYTELATWLKQVEESFESAPSNEAVSSPGAVIARTGGQSAEMGLEALAQGHGREPVALLNAMNAPGLSAVGA
eukprot:6213452-Pleurochrysis_carterae.AAC.2